MLALAFTPSTTAVGGSLVLTALLGLLPLMVFFALLGVFKVPTHWCALASLGLALVAAVLGFHMPMTLSLLSGLQGAVFVLAVIIYIVIMAVWLHNLTERSGRSADVRTVFSVVGMAGGHFVTSHFLSYQLTAVVASLVSFALVALLMVVWQPHTPPEQHSGVTEGGLGASRVTLALLPYWLVVLIFVVAKLWKVGIDLPSVLSSWDLKVKMPGLYGQVLTASGEVSTGPTLSIPVLASPGTMLLLTGVIVTIVYALNSSGGRFAFSVGQGIATLGRTIEELRWAIFTITAVMALAYVMNISGQTVAVGTWLAGTGAAFAFFSPVLGWLGTAVTGSATSSGALFANLQTTVATQTHMNTQLFLAANEVGGGIGKIVSPQNLAIAATAVKEPGLEPKLLRTTAPYSIGLVALLGIIVVLASTGVFGFLIA